MAVVSHAWPTLSTFAGDPWRGVPKVQNALCDVYTRAVLCAKRSAKPLLPHVLAALKDAFTASPSANARCLDVLAVIVEVFSVGGSSGAFAAARDPRRRRYIRRARVRDLGRRRRARRGPVRRGGAVLCAPHRVADRALDAERVAAVGQRGPRARDV